MILVGIDIGTTNWKITGYNLSHNKIISHSLPARAHQDKFGEFYLPEEIWNNVCLLVKKVRNKEEIISVAVASVGESVVLLDKNNKVLYPAIVWYDQRTENQIKQIEEKISRENLFKITGLYPNYIYSLLKILWIKKQFPSIYKRIKKVLSISDYINYKLTGEIASDFSQASRTMLFNVKERKWSQEIISLFKIEKNILPPVYPSGTDIGKIIPGAQRESGLSNNTRVILAGHDHIVGAFGAGVKDEDEILDSIGTAESIFRPLNKIKDIEKIYSHNFSVGCNILPDKYYIIGGIYSSGGAVEWLLREIVKEKKYTSIIAEARRSPLGAKGLFFLPHLLGSGPPNRDIFSRACFLGITGKHKREDLLRSLFEGLSYESRVMIEGMNNIFKKKAKRIVVIGGGAKNKLWVEIKSDVLGANLHIQQNISSVCWGGVLLSGKTLKIFKEKDIENLSRRYLVPHYFHRNNFKKYDIYYNFVYKKIYPTLREINHTISNFS